MSAGKIGSVELQFGAFDIARIGKDEIYRMADERYFEKYHKSIEILEMRMLPVSFEGEEVTYRCDIIDSKEVQDG